MSKDTMKGLAGWSKVINSMPKVTVKTSMEQYIRICSHDELVKIFEQITTKCFRCGMDFEKTSKCPENPEGCPFGVMLCSGVDIEKWLVSDKE